MTRIDTPSARPTSGRKTGGDFEVLATTKVKEAVSAQAHEEDMRWTDPTLRDLSKRNVGGDKGRDEVCPSPGDGPTMTAGNVFESKPVRQNLKVVCGTNVRKLRKILFLTPKNQKFQNGLGGPKIPPGHAESPSRVARIDHQSRSGLRRCWNFCLKNS